jgi:hypothetical protein
MSQQVQFAETIQDTILRYLRNNLPQGYFKAYFYGDPMDIPDSLLPCVVVERLRTQIEAGPTGMDRIVYTCMIKMMYNKRDDYGKSDTDVLGIRALEEMAEGIDPTNGEYDSRTVASILRKNFTLGQILTNQTMLINYGLVNRTSDLMTAECQITVAIDEYKTVTGRV